MGQRKVLCMFVSNFNYSPNFTALRRATYNCKTTNNETKPITIYELEARDAEYIKKLMNSLEMSDECKQNRDYKSKIEVTGGGLGDIYETCLRKRAKDIDFSKTRMFMAFDGKNTCGFIMGNIPKMNKETGEGIQYSVRKECNPTETELDWFATWTEAGAEKIKGVGSALSTEFFISTKNDGFKDIFVQSEIGENSDAQGVYGTFGFKPVGDKITEGELLYNEPKLNENRNELGAYVTPMLLTEDDRNKRIEDKAKTRTELDNVSVNLDTLA